MNIAEAAAHAAAASLAAAEQRRLDRIEDVEFLIGQGYEAQTVADRLGIAPGTLAKSLTRAGRNDLARPFWRADRLQKLGTCRFCGGDTSRKTNTCCQQCRPLAAMETINARRSA